MAIKNVLVTGCLGFIGAATAEALIGQDYNVTGVDCNYYRGMNKFRLEKSSEYKIFDADITRPFIHFNGDENFDSIIHLAAIPGVRDSIRDPEKYYRNNLMGTLNILELMREYKIPKLVFASTSSIYDWDHASYRPMPECGTDLPQHPYAGSKLACEDLCRIYHELHGISVSVLRYHTVYGPAGRPDMAPLKFAHKIANGLPIQLNGNGLQERDFTFIDDVVDANIRAMNHEAGFEVFNIGAGEPYLLNYLISNLELGFDKKAIIEYKNSNNLDASFTWADNTKAREMLGWEPRVSFYDGIERTVSWYQEHRTELQGIEF